MYRSRKRWITALPRRFKKVTHFVENVYVFAIAGTCCLPESQPDLHIRPTASPCFFCMRSSQSRRTLYVGTLRSLFMLKVSTNRGVSIFLTVNSICLSTIILSPCLRARQLNTPESPGATLSNVNLLPTSNCDGLSSNISPLLIFLTSTYLVPVVCLYQARLSPV